MNLNGIKWGIAGWIHLVRQRNQCGAVMNTVKDPQISYNVGKFWTSWETISFSRRTLMHGLR